MFMMVDTNEEVNSPHVVARLRNFFPTLEVTHLDCGDIKIILDNGNVLAIERKTAGDFLGSIADGRVFNQVERMSESSRFCCVLIEGVISFDEDDMTVIPMYTKDGERLIATDVRTKKTREVSEITQWRGASVRGAMYAIQWSGCPVMSIEPNSLPHTIHDLVRFCSKPVEHTLLLGRKRVVTFPQPTLQEEILAAFPGTGLKLARALLAFAKRQNDTSTGTLAEALTWASVLHKIPKPFRPEGWGDMKIHNFRTALGLQPWEEFDVITNKEDKERIQGKEKRQKDKEREELVEKAKKKAVKTAIAKKPSPVSTKVNVPAKVKVRTAPSPKKGYKSNGK